MRRYLLICLATIVTIYILILVGGIVRATGAGMGCPDWPTCFDRWVPPMHESELPANYQQIYADRGYSDTTFNVVKTWTEYLNRLLGVFTGLMILGTLVAAVSLRKSTPAVFNYSLLGFILVGIQGWLGSRVVASNLDPVMITIHMVLAQIIVMVLIYAGVCARKPVLQTDPVGGVAPVVRKVMGLIMLASLLQLIMGTQVREAVDLIAHQSNYANRHLWIDNLPAVFAFHRWFAVPIVLLNLWLVIQVFQQVGRVASSTVAAGALLLVIVGTIIMGMAMHKLHLPVFAQPLHLWFSSLILGLQFFLYMVIRLSSTAAVITPNTDREGSVVAAQSQQSG
ncbi:MAG: COX15/CtaA family protein [Gammaproteobacteria bacterium]|nr:COX15/CtaA family protein [Gammaproteobacteria bacterium]